MISIIIPVYNAKQYLHNCIDSILRQKYKEIEILLIDDGSTDGSAEICDEYKTFDNFVILHQSNQGPSAARNLGIKNAKGRYISFLDSDDTLVENALDDLNEEMDIDIIGYNYFTVSDKTVILRDFSKTTKCKWSFLSRSYSVWNKIYKKTLFEKALFDKETFFGEDLELNIKLFSEAKTFYFNPKPLVNYRIDNIKSLSKNINNSAFEALFKNLDLMEETKKIVSDEEKQNISSMEFKLYMNVLANLSVNKLLYKNFKNQLKKRKKILCNGGLIGKIIYLSSTFIGIKNTGIISYKLIRSAGKI